MKHMPKQLRIGPMYWDIEMIKELHKGDQGLWGYVEYKACAIRIEKQLASQQQRQVLWHEIFHVLLDQAGRMKEKANEKFVDVLATGVYQVLLDNPELAKLG